MAKKSPKPDLVIDCVTAKQGETTLVLFSQPAKLLFEVLDINKREPDKKEGYQRTLSLARVNAIAKYVKSKKMLPLSILVSLDHATLSPNGKKLTIPHRKDAGWVIDGQHRLAGAFESGDQIDLPVVAFLGLPVEKQIEQFVTINREAKGVPTSLYYDLLPQLPHAKSEGEIAKERAADIANELKKDENSMFFNRIVIMSAPRPGEMSLNNFVRKVAPLMHRKSGKFGIYNEIEQRKVMDNYFKALMHVFEKSFKDEVPIFFQTVGFGAVVNALPAVFDLCIKHHKAFRVEDATRMLKLIADFDFQNWRQMGTGTAAENSAGDEFKQRLIARLQDEGAEAATTIRL